MEFINSIMYPIIDMFSILCVFVGGIFVGILMYGENDD